METLLLVLGVLGFAAVVFSAYVFAVAARNYISDNDYAPLPENMTANDERLKVVRELVDRRQRAAANSEEFPLQLASGEVVVMERRMQPERRTPDDRHRSP